MQRRAFLESALLALGATTITKWSMGSLKPPPDWKITMLNKQIGYFTEAGGTIGFHLAKDGITVVDAQFPTSAPHLIQELQKKNLPFRLLINTHHHSDHTSGNIAFKPIIARVVAQENSLKNQRRVAEQDSKSGVQYFPTETFSDGWSEKSGGEIISMHYYGAAHTDGDAVIHFEKNGIAHVGDLVFNRKYPYIDRSAGASIKNWLVVLQKIQTNYPDSTQFICGHAGDGYPVVGNKEMIHRFQNYLTASLAFVDKAMKEGRSKQEILSTTVIPGFTDWKGEGIQRTLAAAYEELAEDA